MSFVGLGCQSVDSEDNSDDSDYSNERFTEP